MSDTFETAAVNVAKPSRRQAAAATATATSPLAAVKADKSIKASTAIRASTVDPTVYKSLKQIEHVLQRPDMYIDEHSLDPRKCIVFMEDRLQEAMVVNSPRLEQMVMEVLANVADALQTSYETTCQ